MTVYFLSSVKSALKLDGEYAGITDNFNRCCDIDLEKGAFAEFVPDGNLMPVNFFMDEQFFRTPHEYADVYRSRAFNAVYVHGFYNKNPSLKVIMQVKFCALTVTVYRQGGIFLSCDGQSFESYPLPEEYADPRAEEVTAGGRKLLAVHGGKWLALIDGQGRLLFMNEAERYSFGSGLEITAPLYTCEDSVAECSFAVDGDITATASRTIARSPQKKELLPFVFFERVLTGADYTEMLCGELQPKAGGIKKYLGNFTAVTVPCESFYRECGRVNAAGLVYPKAKNVYEILFYAIDEEGGKISNVRPV